MPSKTFVMLKKKLPDHFKVNLSGIHRLYPKIDFLLFRVTANGGETATCSANLEVHNCKFTQFYYFCLCSYLINPRKNTFFVAFTLKCTYKLLALNLKQIKYI